ncbi:hypothetical protein [Bradyrhizobium sp. C9]|uniref:hypothetical protein n=1 Tax=Bradyrhizobium sp. C9 TaxID=142585 RepID=UPI0011778127|nr:hypothetical protein [Bradyrhizobium sp. C9]
MSIDELAAAKEAARAEFEAACRSQTITEAEFNPIRERYIAAMRQHHDACAPLWQGNPIELAPEVYAGRPIPVYGAG